MVARAASTAVSARRRAHLLVQAVVRLEERPAGPEPGVVDGQVDRPVTSLMRAQTASWPPRSLRSAASSSTPGSSSASVRNRSARRATTTTDTPAAVSYVSAPRRSRWRHGDQRRGERVRAAAAIRPVLPECRRRAASSANAADERRSGAASQARTGRIRGWRSVPQNEHSHPQRRCGGEPRRATDTAWPPPLPALREVSPAFGRDAPPSPGERGLGLRPRHAGGSFVRPGLPPPLRTGSRLRLRRHFAAECWRWGATRTPTALATHDGPGTTTSIDVLHVTGANPKARSSETS